MHSGDNDDWMRLLSNITHQIINPLNGVIGTLDNIIDGTVRPNKVDQRLRSARGQLECTVSLIRNLAYFAQYTSDYAAKVQSKMDKICVIPQVIIEAAQFYQEQGHQMGVRIELEDGRIQNAVKGNPDLLRQVFMNLFDNAVKYSHRDSVVQVRYWIQKKTNCLLAEVKSKSVRFDKWENIFELGARGRHAEDKTSAGSGIGLHVCKLIVENVFGGSIEGVYQKDEDIAVFTISIPGGFLKDR